MKVEDKTHLKVVNPVKGEGPAVAESEAAKVKTFRPKGKADTVELSRNAELFNKVNDALQNIPDVREERVADLKKRIAAGEYKVEAADVAEKMLLSLKRGVAV